MESGTGHIVELVGDIDDFIQSAPQHAARFHEWLKGKGQAVASDSELLEAVWKHGDEIDENREIFVAACAAYGELIRQRNAGVWVKHSLHGGIEPIIKKPWQPWRRCRVVYDVYESMTAPPLEDL